MQRLQCPCSFSRETLDVGSWKCLELPEVGKWGRPSRPGFPGCSEKLRPEGACDLPRGIPPSWS